MKPKAVDLTILFSDVHGFTRISKALKPVEVSLLNLLRTGPECERYRPCAGWGAEFRRTPSAGWDGVTVFDET